MSQEQLAETAGLHRTYVADIERAARNVSMESMERLANGLGCALWTLLREAE